MPHRVSPTDRVHGHIDELFASGKPLPEILEDVARLVISDGAPGLIAAIEQAFPQALRQRCLVHRARTVLAKVPAGMQAGLRTPTGSSTTPRT
jgi:hypothetical protein